MSWLRDFFGQFQVWGATPRSPKWNKVRDSYIQQNPFCAGCGIASKLEAHHIEPFHVRPDLELNISNLITLCRDCHWYIGHLRDWSLFNPHVIEDAKIYRERFTTARLK